MFVESFCFLLLQHGALATYVSGDAICSTGSFKRFQACEIAAQLLTTASCPQKGKTPQTERCFYYNRHRCVGPWFGDDSDPPRAICADGCAGIYNASSAQLLFYYGLAPGERSPNYCVGDGSFHLVCPHGGGDVTLAQDNCKWQMDGFRSIDEDARCGRDGGISQAHNYQECVYLLAKHSDAEMPFESLPVYIDNPAQPPGCFDHDGFRAYNENRNGPLTSEGYTFYCIERTAWGSVVTAIADGKIVQLCVIPALIGIAGAMVVNKIWAKEASGEQQLLVADDSDYSCEPSPSSRMTALRNLARSNTLVFLMLFRIAQVFGELVFPVVLATTFSCCLLLAVALILHVPARLKVRCDWHFHSWEFIAPPRSSLVDLHPAPLPATTWYVCALCRMLFYLVLTIPYFHINVFQNTARAAPSQQFSLGGCDSNWACLSNREAAYEVRQLQGSSLRLYICFVCVAAGFCLIYTLTTCTFLVGSLQFGWRCLDGSGAQLPQHQSVAIGAHQIEGSPDMAAESDDGIPGERSHFWNFGYGQPLFRSILLQPAGVYCQVCLLLLDLLTDSCAAVGMFLSQHYRLASIQVFIVSYTVTLSLRRLGPQQMLASIRHTVAAGAPSHDFIVMTGDVTRLENIISLILQTFSLAFSFSDLYIAAVLVSSIFMSIIVLANFLVERLDLGVDIAANFVAGEGHSGGSTTGEDSDEDAADRG